MKRNTAPTPEVVRAALFSIPPDCGHELRVRLAFAVFDALGKEAGGELWAEWAGRREGANANEDRATWRSIKPGRVKAGTLFAEAKKRGFKWSDVQASAPAPATQSELRARAQMRRETEQREQAHTAQRQAEAAADARRLWDSGADVTDAAAVPYLARKGVKPYGVRALSDGTLLVPAIDATGELVNVQRVMPQRGRFGTDKLFVKGARKAGTLHLIGLPEGDPPTGAWLLTAEGYATAASLHEATGRPVAVAWDAGNLAYAVRALRGRFPALRLALCADDDRETEARTGKNPGRDKATEAARLAGKGRALVILPSGPGGLPADGSGGTDFNDLHARGGLEAVRAVVEVALQAAGATNGGAAGPDLGSAKKTAPAGREGSGDGNGTGDSSAGGARDRFRVDEAGLWYDPPGDDSSVKVCAPLHVEALARDKYGNGAALILSFDTRFGSRRWVMPLAMLAGDGSAYRAELLDRGLMAPIDKRRRDLLTLYLQTRNPAELVRLVDRVGWHEGPVYVLPRETLGGADGERVLFQSDAPIESAFAQRGTLNEWQAAIGRHCIGNSRLAFFVSLAFAGPLLAWVPGIADGGGFHLVGDSSGGKTTVLRVLASVWGGPEYLQRWRATDNGLEALAAQHSDGLLVLDELAQLDAAKAGEAAYMLANGQGKSRANRTGAARPRQSWRVLFASAGEIGLADHMTEAGKRARAGQELRMIDLPADAGAGFGVFDDRSGFDTAGELAEHLTRSAARVHGTAGRAWLHHLIDNTKDLQARVREHMEAAERDFVPEAASGQVRRVGKRVALVAAAGELATAAGITGWPPGTALAGARACLNAWLCARPGGIGQSEDAQILRQVREWFGRHSEARFTPWERSALEDDHAPKTMQRAGWRRSVRGEDYTTDAGDKVAGEALEWYVLPEVFRTEVCKGYQERAALRLLRDRGHLHVQGQRAGFTCTERVPGEGRCNVYRIKSSLLWQSDE